MRSDILAAAIASLLIGLPTQGSAQSQPARDQSFTHGESKRCETMSGEDKQQCDKEEATKSQGAAAQEAGGPQLSGGDSAAAGGSGTTFTHGESKRCETMTGAAKQQCDKEEATK